MDRVGGGTGCARGAVASAADVGRRTRRASAFLDPAAPVEPDGGGGRCAGGGVGVQGRLVYRFRGHARGVRRDARLAQRALRGLDGGGGGRPQPAVLAGGHAVPATDFRRGVPDALRASVDRLRALEARCVAAAVRSFVRCRHGRVAAHSGRPAGDGGLCRDRGVEARLVPDRPAVQRGRSDSFGFGRRACAGRAAVCVESGFGGDKSRVAARDGLGPARAGTGGRPDVPRALVVPGFCAGTGVGGVELFCGVPISG